ncbi:MAG: class I SAM-dependent methyltransferase [Candidatus Bathyarchaeota archaeon]|nr:class I SAM-dependent methyltransferase [Candidatus Bathyarchaeota archaeon]
MKPSISNMHDQAKKRIRETYRQTAENYDTGVSERLGDSRWGIESLTGLLLRDMRFSDNPVVLDLACGTGLSTFKLIEHLNGDGEFHGVDFSPEMIKQAGLNAETLGYSIDFRVGDTDDLPYPDESFEAIISNMSFQMFPDKPKCLEEAYRVLRPGGSIALLYGAGSHLQELVSLCLEYAGDRPSLTGFKKAVNDVSWMHIDLEETQRLFWEAGFRRPLIYGYHRVMHVDPKQFWHTNPYTALWRTHVPVDLRERVDKEIISLMESKASRGFKVNWYTIQAYGSKPR